MAKMVTNAGNLEMKIIKVTASNKDLIVTGRFGAWDGNVIFDLEEIKKMIGLVFNWPVIRYFLCLPFRLVWHIIKKKANGKAL